MKKKIQAGSDGAGTPAQRLIEKNYSLAEGFIRERS